MTRLVCVVCLDLTHHHGHDWIWVERAVLILPRPSTERICLRDIIESTVETPGIGGAHLLQRILGDGQEVTQFRQGRFDGVKAELLAVEPCMIGGVH